VNSIFSLDSYRDLITELLNRGYKTCDFENAEPDKRHLILRHDIDMSLDAALAIAEIERTLGIKGHYFVLVRTEMYNPFSAAAGKALKKLATLGHAIGLHLDASLYDNDLAALDRAAAEECATLELAAGVRVKTISFHRPVQKLLGYSKPIAGRIHAYQPRFYSEMGYCSDSQGAWRHGHPLENAAVQKRRALQLLTHPIWWVGPPAEDAIARLDHFLANRHEALRREVALNCKPYGAVYSSEKPAS
jgi:hypothetical protein